MMIEDGRILPKHELNVLWNELEHTVVWSGFFTCLMPAKLHYCTHLLCLRHQ